MIIDESILDHYKNCQNKNNRGCLYDYFVKCKCINIKPLNESEKVVMTVEVMLCINADRGHFV